MTFRGRRPLQKTPGGFLSTKKSPTLRFRLYSFSRRPLAGIRQEHFAHPQRSVPHRESPAAAVPSFLALTREYPASARRILARQVAMNSFVLLIAFVLVGTHILEFFGISIPVVQVGAVLLSSLTAGPC